MGKTILVVDDDPAVRRVISEILSVEGYEIREALGGQAGLRAVEEFQRSLVLVDVELPDIDGLEVCQGLEQQAATAHLPVALISGKADKGRDKVAGFAAGAD